jgi:hypothetical protein
MYGAGCGRDVRGGNDGARRGAGAGVRYPNPCPSPFPDPAVPLPAVPRCVWLAREPIELNLIIPVPGIRDIIEVV